METEILNFLWTYAMYLVAITIFGIGMVLAQLLFDMLEDHKPPDIYQKVREYHEIEARKEEEERECHNEKNG